MPKKTLILHIGGVATESATLHQFFRENLSALRGCGIVVAPSTLIPGNKVLGHHSVFFEQYRKNIAEGQHALEERVNVLMSDLKDGERLLISADGLSIPDGIHRLFETIAERYELQVLLYIRRQDELLLTAWEQSGSRKTADFWAWMTGRVGGTLGNWRQTLVRWEQLIPRSQIAVRVLDRERFPAGHIGGDFLEYLGISELPSELKMWKPDPDPYYAAAVHELARGAASTNTQPKPLAEFYGVVDELTGEEFHRTRRPPVLTQSQRLAILERYAAVNAWVQKSYFPDSQGPLFAPPQADEPVTGAQEANTTQKWQLLASLIFGLGKRVLRTAE